MSFSVSATLSLPLATISTNQLQTGVLTVTNNGTDAVSVLGYAPGLTNPTRPAAFSTVSAGAPHAPGAPLPTGTDNELPTWYNQNNTLNPAFVAAGNITPVASSSLVFSGPNPTGGVVSGGTPVAPSASVQFTFKMSVGGFNADSLTVVCPVMVLDTVTGVVSVVQPTGVSLTVTSQLAALGT
jgi:hypothetical protein